MSGLSHWIWSYQKKIYLLSSVCFSTLSHLLTFFLIDFSCKILLVFFQGCLDINKNRCALKRNISLATLVLF